jgi:hypothetical protein
MSDEWYYAKNGRRFGPFQRGVVRLPPEGQANAGTRAERGGGDQQNKPHAANAPAALARPAGDGAVQVGLSHDQILS